VSLKTTDPAAGSLPNPNPTVIKNWGELPDGRTWGSTAGVDIGPDGHVWAYDRCGANDCLTSKVNPIVKFDRNSGKLLTSFGGGQIVFPHGIHVDRQGNVWITDGRDNGADGKPATMGHQVIKFSPDGKVLMRIGHAGMRGNKDGMLNEPNDVITAPNGDVFISDGHSGQGMTSQEAIDKGRASGQTGRILKYTADGKYVKEWGSLGTGQGQFRTPHALAMDSRGRLYVADRGNHRIQIFDQNGGYITSYYQFSRISGLFIDAKDNLYAIDSETNPKGHPGWKTGIRIGPAAADKVVSFIPPHDNGQPHGAAGEGIAVDPDGNVYAAEGPISRQAAGGGLTKYVRPR
jgi:DNA-binding beta-propeller fold protein YncE